MASRASFRKGRLKALPRTNRRFRSPERCAFFRACRSIGNERSNPMTQPEVCAPRGQLNNPGPHARSRMLLLFWGSNLWSKSAENRRKEEELATKNPKGLQYFS